MRSWIGTALLWNGVLAGVLAVALLVFGLPVALPSALVALVAAKLALAAAMGLFVAGALLRRSGARRLPPPAGRVLPPGG